jgi:hypothetical protein
MVNPMMIRRVTSPWDPGSFKPLDMSKIPGYPRQMPPISKKRWLPEFTGWNGERADLHMNKFYSYFQLHPVADEAEDVVMILFANTLHGYAREWYYNLPDASITSMDQFEEVFLEKWGIKAEDIPVLLKNFEDIKQGENETLFHFQNRFEGTLYHIPASHRPGREYVVHHYTHAIWPHLGLPLRKRAPKTLDEAYCMAKEIRDNISSSGINDLFTSGTLTMESLYSHENIVDDFQEEGKQTIIQYEMIEDVAEETESEQNDEGSISVPPSDEAIQESFSPAQQKEDEVSCFSMISNDTLFHDSGKEEEMQSLDKVEVPCCATENEEVIHEDEEMTRAENIKLLKIPAQEETVSCSPLIKLDDVLPCDEEEEDEFSNLAEPACYDTDTDMADFDEFIHVGRRRWDVIGYDLDPIYDTESHLQLLPLQLSQQITYDQWQQGDEVFTCSLQNTKDDLVPCFSDDFQSYLEMFDEYAEHLNPFYEDEHRPPLCSDLATSKDIVCLKEITHDFPSQPPVISLPGFSIQGVIGKYLFRVEFPPGQTLDFKGWLGNTISNQFFNLLLMICQPSTKLLSILPLESEDVLGNQSTGPLCPFSEPCTFYDPFLDRIEYFSQRWTWQYFDPPTRLHELGSDFSDDMMYILTHDIFVLDVSLFWFMMKHKGRYQGALLDWLHWLFDYTNLQPTGKYR